MTIPMMYRFGRVGNQFLRIRLSIKGLCTMFLVLRVETVIFCIAFTRFNVYTHLALSLP